MSVIVIEFITLDGIVSDPDGSGGTPAGGWAFRHGPEAVAGDKFRLGRVLDDGVMLLGRRTWELFAKIWPGRDTPFAQRMNAVPKLVVSGTLTDASAWANSQVAADPVDVVRREPRDVIITGSLSVVHPLITAGLIVVADVGVTLAYQEPLSSLYSSIKQSEKAHQLKTIESDFLTKSDVRSIDRAKETIARVEVAGVVRWRLI